MNLCTALGKSVSQLFAFATQGFAVAGFASIAIYAASPASAAITTSQSTSNQLNQLFFFETTNNKSAAQEAYVSGEFAYLDYSGPPYQYRYQVQGQYSFTDQLALGGFVPVIHSKLINTNTGLGDLTLYGQYKLDQIIPHDVLDLTGQLDVVLPTGDRHEFRDTGRFGVRPMVQAYKDVGDIGPGRLGAYGELGFTLASDSDVRFGLAGTYEIQKFIGMLEFYTQAGSKLGRPLVLITPGLCFRPGAYEFTIGIPCGLNKGSPDWGVIVKATVAL